MVEMWEVQVFGMSLSMDQLLSATIRMKTLIRVWYVYDTEMVWLVEKDKMGWGPCAYVIKYTGNCHPASHSVDTGWQAKMASIELWIQWCNAHGPRQGGGGGGQIHWSASWIATALPESYTGNQALFVQRPWVPFSNKTQGYWKMMAAWFVQKGWNPTQR